jgi:uncharacterized protein YggE
MSRTSSSLIALMPIAWILVLSGCVNGPDVARPRTIAVVGRAEMHVAPDVFFLNVGVEHRDKDLDKVRLQVTEASQRIIGAAKSFPIDETRTRTRCFNIERITDRETCEFKSYEVSQYLDVYLRDLSKAQELTAAVLHAGATHVSIDFLAEQNRDELIEQARLAALRDARRQAERLAAVYGERVGAPLEIGQPDQNAGTWAVQFFQGASGAGNADTQAVRWIAPTEVEIAATVFVRFTLMGPGRP